MKKRRDPEELTVEWRGTTSSIDNRIDKLAKKYDTNGDGKYSLNEVRAIIRELLEANVEKRRFKGLALGLAGLTALALAALVILGVVIIFMLRDYDKEETGPNLPAMQMNGNIVGTREAIVKLNLLAAIGMEMLRLQQVKSLAVSITLTGNATSLIAAVTTVGTRTMGLVKATFGVASVTKISETMVVFHTLVPNLAIIIKERMATLKLMDPATGAVLESAFLCSSSVDCGALHVKGSEEEELVEKAEVALAATAERRRLNPDTSPRKLSETCMDPRADDPTALECECLEEMQESCGERTEECFRKILCCQREVCQEWKDENCGAYPGCKRRALYSTEPAGDRFDEEPAECADSPVEILSSEVERLGFPAASSCSEMLSIGACDHDLVKHHLCAKTCGGCDVESDGQAASRRQLGKCSQ